MTFGEYIREQSTSEWLPMMGAAVAEALGVSAENVHLKERHAGKQDGKRYERIDQTIPQDYANKRKRIHRCWKLIV